MYNRRNRIRVIIFKQLPIKIMLNLVEIYESLNNIKKQYNHLAQYFHFSKQLL